MKNLLLNKIQKNKIPRYIVLFIDIYIVLNTYLFAYFITNDALHNFHIKEFLVKTLVIAIVSLLSFILVGLYKGLVRYSGVKDVVNVFKAAALIFLIIWGYSLIMENIEMGVFSFRFITLFIHLFLNIICLSVARYLFVVLYQKLRKRDKGCANVLIYGAGDSGRITLSTLQREVNLQSKIIGFIDDNKSKEGKKLDGITIYHSKAIDQEFINKHNVKEIIISIQNIKSDRLFEITNNLSELVVKIKIIPPVADWLDGTFNTKAIKEVNIEDLLGRDPINFNNPVLEKEFKGKTILITGAAGSIGSEIARQVVKFDYKQVVLLDQAESALYDLQQFFFAEKIPNVVAIVADVRNLKRMEWLFSTYQPEIIFHASAYKHVPFMEANPYEAVYVNVYGTKIIADLAVKYKANKFVMISTDKAVNPTNIMGTTKRIAEIYVSTLRNNGVTKFMTTRFGNVLGSNGSVIPLFKEQIKRGGPLTVTDKEITRFFMTIPEACRLVLEAGAMGNGGEIFVFDMGESVKIYDLAKKMIQLSGFRFPEDIDIEIVGLRPGEKIYEEVLASSENMQTTYNPKIQIANVRKIDEKMMAKKINYLCELIQIAKNDEEIVIVMKEIVPEFVSKNSRFEKLDKQKNGAVLEKQMS